MERMAIYALVAALVLGSAGAVGFHRGHASATQTCALDRAAAVERATAQAQSIAAQDAEISAGFETTRTRIQTVYQDKIIEVVREISANCAQCRIGPAGLGLLNNAITGTSFTPPATGKPDQPLRPTPPADGWHFPGSGRQIGGIERKTL